MLVLQNLPSGGRPHALPPSFRPAAHIPAELTVRVRVLARSPPRATELTRQALSRAAAIAAHALGVKRGWRVLDMCAAPGGKATHVAALLGGSGRVVACDRSVARLAALDALVLRLGLAGEVETRLLDGTRAGDVLPALSFDAVLLDPPCSALGVRPRLRTLPTIAELDAHAEYQRRLLRSAEALLKPGGPAARTCPRGPLQASGEARGRLPWRDLPPPLPPCAQAASSSTRPAPQTPPRTRPTSRMRSPRTRRSRSRHCPRPSLPARPAVGSGPTWAAPALRGAG